MVKKWIFSFENRLSDAELSILKSKLSAFLNDWDSHGVMIQSDFNIYYQQILEVKIEDSSEVPSGCSIDTLKKQISRIALELGLKLFDSNLIIYQTSDGLKGVRRDEIKNFVSKNIIKPDTLVFDVNFEPSSKSPYLTKMMDSWIVNYLS